MIPCVYWDTFFHYLQVKQFSYMKYLLLVSVLFSTSVFTPWDFIKTLTRHSLAAKLIVVNNRSCKVGIFLKKSKLLFNVFYCFCLFVTKYFASFTGK